MRRLLSVLAVIAVCAPVCAGVWTEVDLPTNRELRTRAFVNGITAHPRIAGLVFASSFGGTFRSSDWGFHWKRVEGLPYDFGFTFNPFDDREICSGGQYVSRDLGTSFSPFASAPEIFDPRIPNRAYRLGDTHLFERSDDGGQTWSGVGPTYPLGPPFSFSHLIIWAAAIDSNSTLYVTGALHGGFCPFHDCTTYRSRDAGLTWEAAFTNRYWTLAGSTLFAFASDAITGNSVETITTYASVDGGTTWERRGVLNTETNASDIGGFGPAVAVDPRGSTILIGLVTIHDGQLYRSDDGGRSWSRIDNGEFQDSHHNRPYPGVEGIAIGADGTVYVTTEHRVFTNRIDDQRRRPVAHRKERAVGPPTGFPIASSCHHNKRSTSRGATGVRR
ncbi:MAG TPA: hypothetical protein VNN08_24660 [Thermoanaerobaculia bacterium]|nr:hypothetical protein [Thermoanaerobaculia bacterium]